ncbi:hypothetical protein Q4560_00140 [Celeribacter halophilus]|jgi:hypothetical protein|uniref:hypothetical protein n=1 Tax=Celeribacter halophilus TaxID=576117 RepID=UPI0026E15F66|nr:hypothetical protein [Celeribacter halophilus]MDO6721665.1 hypothetical protein [Celeribacter halophilus]
MKLKSLSLIDGQFVDAEITTDTGTINVEAEISFIPPIYSSIPPIYIGHAVWKETGDHALGYIAQHFDAVRDLITQELTHMVE